MTAIALPRVFNRLTETCLRIIGIWPGSRYTVLYRCACVATIGVAQYFQYWYLYAHFASDDPSDLVESLSTTLTYSLTFIKLLTVWSNRRVYYDILSAMAADWSDATLTDWDENVMTSQADLSRRCCNCIITGFWMCMSLYVFDIIVSWLVFGERRLVMRMEFPMNVTMSPTYELIVLGQLVQQLLVVTVESIINALIITLIFHAGSQVDIIRRRLLQMSSLGAEKSEMALKSLVYKHNQIVIFFTNIKDFYSYIALMNFLLIVIILCLIAFVIVISMDTGKGPMAFIKFLPYYAGVNFMAFVPCFTGEYVSLKSRSIGDAAYESHWYNLKPKVSRGILLFILRSQKPLTITAGNIVDLSLECFLTIMKASASYASVLHAIY